MKASRKRIKLMRSVAIAGCLAGLAAPSFAAAMPLPGDPPSSPATSDTTSAPTQKAPVNGGRTIAVRHENQSSSRVGLAPVLLHPHGRPVLAPTNGRSFVLASNHTTDTQSSARSGAQQAYVLPASHTTDVQSSPPGSTPVSTPSQIVREVHTITSGNDHTLAIVLAAAALGIALLGTGYALTRVALVQRRMVGSSS
jgi:hypothetical protein